MPAGDAFWLCHECRAEMRPIELDEDVNPDPFAELPHPPTRPGQAPRHASPDPDDNPDFFSSMFTRLLGAQPGQQAGPPGRSGGGSSSSAIRNLGSPAAMHGQRPPEGGQGRSYEFTVPGGGSGRIVIGGFGGGGGGRGGGGFMLGGGSGAGGTGQNANPFFPGFPPTPNPYRSNHQHTHTHTHTHNDLTPMPEDQLLQALMEMIASENDMAPQMLFGGMPGFGATRGGASSFGDYATTEHGFNEILERLMHAAGPQGPIPAADAVIDNLPRSSFDDKSLAASVYKDCPVCKDDFAAGDEYIRIPCAHIFHPDCLTPWLKQNGSCPVCRYSLVSDDNGPAAATGPATAANPSSSSSAGTRPPQPSTAQGQTAQTTDDQPESFFTSILNRLWGPSGEARSPTTETFPGMASQADEIAVPRFPGAMPRDSAGADRGSGLSTRGGEVLPPLAPASNASSGDVQEQEQEQDPQSLYAGFQARTRSFHSTPSESPSRTPAPASGQTNGAHADPPDPVLRNVSSAIPDDYRARHRQREQEAERERERDRRNLPHDDLD